MGNDEKKIDRIAQVEEWLEQLDLRELSILESKGLIEPVLGKRKEIFEELVGICKERYRLNSYWPDFSKIGFERAKEYKKVQRIFAIGL